MDRKELFEALKETRDQARAMGWRERWGLNRKIDTATFGGFLSVAFFPLAKHMTQHCEQIAALEERVALMEHAMAQEGMAVPENEKEVAAMHIHPHAVAEVQERMVEMVTELNQKYEDVDPDSPRPEPTKKTKH